MAGLIPMCDSDEEVFYGPITARELELDWRRLMAEKEKKRLDPTDQPDSNSGEVLNQSSSSASGNEPLKESTLKNNSIRFIDDDDDDTMDVDAEPSLAINRSDVKILEGENNGELKGANHSGLIGMSFKEFDTAKDENISIVSDLLKNSNEHSVDKVTTPRLIETYLKDSAFAEGVNALAKPAKVEDKNDQTTNDVSELKLNDIRMEHDFDIGENNTSNRLCNMESSNNKSMSEIGVRMNDTTINELIISKEDGNISVKPNNLNDGTYLNVAEVSGLNLNEISIKDSSIAACYNDSVIPNIAEDSVLNMDEITGLRWNEIKGESNFDEGLNNSTVTINMKETDQNRIEITDVSLNENSVTGYNFILDEKNTSFIPQMGGDSNQTTAAVVHETNMMSNIVEDENNTSTLSNLEAMDNYMTEAPEVGIFKQNDDESQIEYMPTYTEDAIVQNLGEITSANVNETSLMESNVAECDMNAPARITKGENISKMTDTVLNGTNMECNDDEEENNASVIAVGELTVSAMITNTEDCIDQNMSVVTNVRLNESNVMEPNVAESENNASSMLTNTEVTSTQNMVVFTDVVKLNETNAHNSENNASAVLTYGEVSGVQSMNDTSGVGLNETTGVGLNETTRAGLNETTRAGLNGTTGEGLNETSGVRLNETNVLESNVAERLNNVSGILENTEVSSVQNVAVTDAFGSSDTSVMEGNVESEKEAPTMLSIVGDMTFNEKGTDNFCYNKSQSWERVADQCKLEVSSLMLNETSLLLDSIAEQNNTLTVLQKFDDAEVQIMEVTNTIELNDIAKVVDQISCKNNASPQVSLKMASIDDNKNDPGVLDSGVESLTLDQKNIISKDNVVIPELSENQSERSDYSEKSFVSLKSYEELSCENKYAEGTVYAPPNLDAKDQYMTDVPEERIFVQNDDESQIGCMATYAEDAVVQNLGEITSVNVKETSLMESNVAECDMNASARITKGEDSNVQNISKMTDTVLNGTNMECNDGEEENNASVIAVGELTVSAMITNTEDCIDQNMGIVTNVRLNESNVMEPNVAESENNASSMVTNTEVTSAQNMVVFTDVVKLNETNAHNNENNASAVLTYGEVSGVQSMNDTTGVGLNETTRVGLNGTTGEGLNETTGVGLNETTGVGLNGTTGVGLNGTTRVGLNGTTGEGLNETTGVGLNETTGVGLNGTTEVGLNVTTGVGLNVTTGVGLNKTNVLESNVTERLNNVSGILENTEVSSAQNVAVTDAFGSSDTSVMEGNVESEKEAPTMLSIVGDMTFNEKGTDNFCFNKSHSWERVADQCKLEVSSLMLNETSLLLDSIVEQNNADDAEVEMMEVTNNIDLNGIAMVVDQISCKYNASPQVSLKMASIDDNKNYPRILDSGVESLALDQQNIISEVNVVIRELSENKSESSDSSEKSFVSLKSYEELSSEDKSAEDMLYGPPGKKKCIQSTPGKENFIQSNPRKNKEIEDSKSRIPVPSASRLPVLKPPTLKLDNFVNTTPWASDFRKKKIPQPKKPAYVVSPGKLDRILKTTPVNRQIRPRTADGSVKSTPTIPLQCSNRNISTPNIASTPLSSVKLISPSLKQFPLPTKKKVDTPLKTSPKNPKFKAISSPVAEYIKNPPSLIRNVTPTKGSICPISTGKNKENRENAVKSPKPEVFISPKYYSSANRRVLTSSSINKSPVLPKMGERQTAVFSASPKIQILKHTGRVLSGEKNLGEETVGIVRPTRKTSLSNTSFAGLPPSSDLDMSTVQKL